uniref:Terpine synthase-like protein MTPSL1 n=1 Tax=Anthoceros punctatus TaxID=3234 RepID=A0A2P1ED40_ANTPU|nr:terpine synthase-like protein MTPSL1 [Anthoceros punctatus]
MAPDPDQKLVVGAQMKDVTGTRKLWFSDPGPRDAAMAAAQQALASCKLDIDRIPTPSDIHLPLPASEYEKLADGSGHMAEWWRTVGVSRFVQERGLADLEARLEQFVVIGHYCVGFMFHSAVSSKLFDAMAGLTAALFMVDDLCFDEDLPEFRPGEVHRGDIAKARAFIRAWCQAVRADSPDPPPGGSDVARLQAWAWGSARELKSLSTPDCFDAVMDTMDAYAEACLAMREDVDACTRDVEAYARVRGYNGACIPLCVMTETAVQEFLPEHVRAHPAVQKLAWAACFHVCFLNDIFSYDKDVAGADPGFAVFNLLAVLMRAEGMEPLQALRRSVEMVNAYSCAFLQAEKELPAEWDSPGVDSAVRRHVLALKELVCGHFYFATRCLPHRFRWPDFSPSDSPAHNAAV